LILRVYKVYIQNPFPFKKFFHQTYSLGVRLYLKHIAGTDTAKIPEHLLINGNDDGKRLTGLHLVAPVLIDPSAQISSGKIFFNFLSAKNLRTKIFCGIFFT